VVSRSIATISNSIADASHAVVSKAAVSHTVVSKAAVSHAVVSIAVVSKAVGSKAAVSVVAVDDNLFNLFRSFLFRSFLFRSRFVGMYSFF